MIEFLTAKDGDRIFKWNGRLLCSSFSPRQEAKKWVEANKIRLQKYNDAVILGLGNGFHILEVLQVFKEKKFYVINFCPEILVPALSTIGIRESHVTVISAESIEELKSDDKFKAILSRPFSLVDFPAAMGFESPLYAQAKEILLGRTQESLAFYAVARTQFASKFNINELKEIRQPAGVRLIDMKQMRQQTKWDQMSRLESCVLNALGELAK